MNSLHRLRFYPALLVCLYCLLCGVSLAHGEELIIENDKFSPADYTATVGESVTWRNADNQNQPHSINIDGTKGRWLKPGQSYSFTPEKVGKYLYACGVHPEVKGVLLVTAATGREVRAAAISHEQSKPNTVGIVDFMRFEPAEIVINVGEKVTWDNHDGSNHKIQFSDSVSPRLGHNASYSKKFDKPGIYDYVCSIHGKRMSGKVIVK